jgi:hypothetical protein
MHDCIHAKSGQDLPLKLQYIRTEKEAVMGWVCWDVYQLQIPLTLEYTDYSTLRNVHCCIPRTAEERSHQRSKCRCAVGEEGRSETLLEGCTGFLVLYNEVCIY